MPCYLGIDLGTSGLKAALVRADGTILSIGYHGLGIDVPYPGFAQQNPDIWCEAARDAIAQAVQQAGIPATNIRGIGFSGQMHGLVALGEDRKPLYPSIIWCDQRSAKQSQRVRKDIGIDQLGKWTQNAVCPGFQLSTILWLRDEMPELYDQLRSVMLPKDYLRMCMTDEIATEPTDACSTLMYDCARQDWSEPLLNRFDIPDSILPDAKHRPYQTAGRLTAHAAEYFGLAEGTLVAFGGGDQPMQAIGNGILLPGDASLTLGTGGQIFVPTSAPVYDPILRTHTFCHAPENRWYVMGATLGACLSQNWFLEKVLCTKDYKTLDAEASQVAPGCEGLIFLPYLTGERTPHMDPQAKGVFFGLTLRHERAAMVRAVLEGVAFSLLDAMGVITQLNLPIDRLILAGGGATSSLWRQVIADVFHRPLYSSAMREEAALGAAICAMVACGEYASLEEACGAIVRYEEEYVQPNESRAEVYREQYALFKDLYRVNAPLMHQTGGI